MNTQTTQSTNNAVAVKGFMKSVYDAVLDFYLVEEGYENLPNGDTLAEQYANQFVSECYWLAGANQTVENLIDAVEKACQANGVNICWMLEDDDAN